MTIKIDTSVKEHENQFLDILRFLIKGALTNQVVMYQWVRTTLDVARCIMESSTRCLKLWEFSSNLTKACAIPSIQKIGQSSPIQLCKAKSDHQRSEKKRDPTIEANR